MATTRSETFLSSLGKRLGPQLISTAVVLCSLFTGELWGQSSPLTVQPSTGRIGIGNTNPQHPLDVTGAIRATGNITASGFVGDGSQLTNLPASGGSALNKVTADTTVTNTSAETNLYSFSVPGGTLGTNNMLRLTVQITDLDMNNSGSCVLRFKYGGTTFGTLTLTNGSGGSFTNVRALISVVFGADGATNSQVGTVTFQATSVIASLLAGGATTVDSSTAQDLVVTADWDATSTTRSITLGHAVLEKIS